MSAKLRQGYCIIHSTPAVVLFPNFSSDDFAVDVYQCFVCVAVI